MDYSATLANPKQTRKKEGEEKEDDDDDDNEVSRWRSLCKISLTKFHSIECL